MEDKAALLQNWRLVGSRIGFSRKCSMILFRAASDTPPMPSNSCKRRRFASPVGRVWGGTSKGGGVLWAWLGKGCKHKDMHQPKACTSATAAIGIAIHAQRWQSLQNTYAQRKCNRLCITCAAIRIASCTNAQRSCDRLQKDVLR